MKRRYEYERNLPHYQKDGRAHFVTFVTDDDGACPLRLETSFWRLASIGTVTVLFCMRR